ncbi:MAG TPA: hypothetical protein VN921_03010 [Chthoniobacterales bacterium]|nr:hypothetical protein [Chthoniobacterales bacterium]
MAWDSATESGPLVALDFDLAAGNEFVAHRADAPAIERRPFAMRICRAQNFEPIFQGKLLLHRTSRNKGAAKHAIGQHHERSIEKLLRRSLFYFRGHSFGGVAKSAVRHAA